MNFISVDSVSKSSGEKALFSDVSFGIQKGDRLALLGVNGCGKTTLLNILDGSVSPESGTVSRNKNIDVRYLRQIPQYNPKHSVLDHIFSSENQKIRIVREYELLCSEADDTLAGQTRLSELMEEMERLNVWEYENEVKTVLHRLEISDLHQKMGTLSGGMLKKVALASVLVSEADLILLDEPTNHLDLDTIMWLQNYLKESSRTLLMVTHDRYFLEEICTGIFEIHRQSLYTYQGSYRFYLEKKNILENSLIKEELRIQNILRTELKWLKSGVKARGTKARARKDRIETMLSREKPEDQKTVELETSGRRLGKHILEVEDISKTFDGIKVLSSFSYVFKKNEKIGLIGPNGSGKTTFLNLITEKITSDTGFVNRGVNTVFGVFDQHTEISDPEIKVKEFLEEVGTNVEMADGSVISCASMLERFLFPRTMHYSPVSSLSGGERKRLFLIRVLMGNPNFLILDEPTNDLDIMTLSVLEDFLMQFKGCLIVVSHDRYFMDKVADHLFIFSETCIKGFPGKCSEYLIEKDKEQNKKGLKKNSHKKDDVSVKKERKGLSYKEKKELELIEADIEKLESEKAEIEARLSDGSSDRDLLAELGVRFNCICESLEGLELRWIELSEKQEEM